MGDQICNAIDIDELSEKQWTWYDDENCWTDVVVWIIKDIVFDPHDLYQLLSSSPSPERYNKMEKNVTLQLKVLVRWLTNNKFNGKLGTWSTEERGIVGDIETESLLTTEVYDPSSTLSFPKHTHDMKISMKTY